MSKYNLEKAKATLKAAQAEAFRDEMISSVITETTAELLADLEKQTGWKKSHFAHYIGYSYNAVKRWAQKNENTRVVKDVCNSIKRAYWHDKNKDRFSFDFEEKEV
jgi:DNA-binding transcriptional regulator YiaG